MFRVLKSRNFYIMLVMDGLLFSLSLFLAYYLRFDGKIPSNELLNFLKIVYWVVPVKLFFFFYFNLYKGMWRYTGIQDLKNLVKGCLAGSSVVVAILMLTVRFEGYPRSIIPLDLVFTFVLAGGVRIGIRLYFGRESSKSSFGLSVLGFELKGKELRTPKNILIVGAGDAGEKTLRELKENPRLNYKAIGFVDDDPGKQGRGVHDVSVLGRLEDIPWIVLKEKVKEIIIAVPSASGQQMRKIVAQCEATGVPYKTLPGLGELIDGRVSVKALRDVDYHDLLGRPKVDLNVEAIGRYLTNKVVLVTGAGGSIGSELCRQIVRFSPETMVLFDASEPSLYAIQMELKHRVGYLKYRTVLGSVQNGLLTDAVFKAFRPHVVFHAAAYKHVPMLERNPWETVFNNIVGSRTVIESAIDHGVDRFVLVSTDKAVRPTNVMGASKRMAEMLLQSYQGNGTRLILEAGALAKKHDGCGIRGKLKEMIPEYVPGDSECVI